MTVSTYPIIGSAKEYIKNRFLRYPHYSFGDGSIMYNHTLLVYQYAKVLAEGLTCNLLVTELCALFHDIGKTLEFNAEVLEKNHEALGWQLTEQFLKTHTISSQDTLSVKLFFEGQDSIERSIVKDADILAFVADPVLQSAYIKWATDAGKYELIDKKLSKCKQLKFDRAKELVEELQSKVIK